MVDAPARLAERLLSEGQKSIEFFQALKPEHWKLDMYSDGAGWQVRDVLAHFVSAEDSITRLILSIRSGGAGTPEDFDLNAYNERKAAALGDLPPDELMQRFMELRRRTSNMVREMLPDELAKTGRHPFLGVATLTDIIKLMYRHNQIHQREIRKRLTDSTAAGEHKESRL